jgi:anti-anti-sigma regulatory factor
VQVIVQCEPDLDPDLSGAPSAVLVRPRDVERDNLQQLRRVLQTLVTTATRNVVIDLAEISVTRRANVVAVLVGAAREARKNGGMLQVINAPAEGARALFVAGIDEPTDVDTSYEIVVGGAELATPIAV